MSKQKFTNCSFCGNNTCISCEHTTSNSCIECEKDDDNVIIDGVCFFCLCEGKTTDLFEYKPREVMARSIDAVKLGKKRRKLGLPPPVLNKTYYIDLFMEGYNLD